MRILLSLLFVLSILAVPSVLWFFHHRIAAVVWLLGTLIISAVGAFVYVQKDVTSLAEDSSNEVVVTSEEPKKELENSKVKTTFYQPKEAASGISRSVDREWVVYADSGNIEKIVHTSIIEVDNSSVSNFMAREENESDEDFKARIKKAEDDYFETVLSGIKENGYLNKDVETVEVDGNTIKITVTATEANFDQVKSISSLYLQETWPTYNKQFSTYAALDAVDVEEIEQ